MIDMLVAVGQDAPECVAPHDSPAALAIHRVPIDPADPPLTYAGRRSRKVVIVKPDYFWAYDEWVGATGYIRGRDAGLVKVQVAWQRGDDGRLAAEMIYLYPEEYRHADGKYRKDRKPAAAAALPG